MFLEPALVLDVALGLAALHLEQRWLGDEEIAALDEFSHLAVEEGEEEGPDVAAIDVGVGHDDDLVVAGLVDVELVSDPTSDRCDQRLDLLAREHLVEPGALDVEDLPADREDRLGLARATLLRGATGGVALDDEELRLRRVALLAIRQLARKAVIRQRPLSPREIAGLAGRSAGPRGIYDLGDDHFCDRRILLEIVAELLVENSFDEAADFTGSELGLRLTLELRLRQLDRDDGRQAFAAIVAADGFDGVPCRSSAAWRCTG